MKQTRVIMGMPVTAEVVDEQVTKEDLEIVFAYFKFIDRKFSTYKKESEISKINRGELREDQYSKETSIIFTLSEQTKQETKGYFDIQRNGQYDPSGLVKGWAIYQAAQLLKDKGFYHFSIEAGGDIQVAGKNKRGESWRIGIRNPFKQDEVIKVLSIDTQGVATSGTYIRGQHVYNPHDQEKQIKDIISLTVIGPNIYEADRFATAAFAMGEKGIHFIEQLPGFEAYMINVLGVATMTSNFEKYVQP